MAVGIVEVLLVLTVIFWLLLNSKNKKDPRYPPGPPSLPLIGNLIQLGSKPHLKLTEWSKIYGPIFSMKMGNDDVIVLNDHKHMKELLSENHGSGRSQSPVFQAFGNGSYGVVNTEGAHWEEQRRFTLRKLRDFGFAKSSMEALILEEANSLLRYFGKNLGKPITGNKIFNGAVVNALWSIVSGERNEWDAPKPPEVLVHAEDVIEALNTTTKRGLLFAPALRFLAPEFFGWTGLIKGIEKVMEFTDSTIGRHKKQFNPHGPQDFIDHYLVEMQQAKDPKSSFYKQTGEKNLSAVIADLFMAGSETTSHTMSWFLLYMSHHHHVQRKVQMELDNVVGSSRQPSVSDKPSMPYLEATLMEVLRLSNLLPNGVLHRMLDDVVFRGYFFPKGTTVLTNLWKVLHDPEIWGDAMNFRPERFLNDTETKIVRNEALIPFGIGKRECLGSSLAKDTLFLFTSCILQKYNISQDPNNLKPDFDTMPGFLSEPKPFKVVFELRN